MHNKKIGDGNMFSAGYFNIKILDKYRHGVGNSGASYCLFILEDERLGWFSKDKKDADPITDFELNSCYVIQAGVFAYHKIDVLVRDKNCEIKPLLNSFENSLIKKYDLHTDYTHITELTHEPELIKVLGSPVYA